MLLKSKDDNTQGQYPIEASASEVCQVDDDDIESHLQSPLRAAEKRVTPSLYCPWSHAAVERISNGIQVWETHVCS